MAKFVLADASELDFIRWDGEIITPGEMVSDITRTAVNGVALQKRGTRGEPFNVTGIRDVQNADLATTLASWKALLGTVVSWVDNQAVTHSGIAVMRVPQPRIIPTLNPVGGLEGSDADWLVYQPFTLLDTSIS